MNASIVLKKGLKGRIFSVLSILTLFLFFASPAHGIKRVSDGNGDSGLNPGINKMYISSYSLRPESSKDGFFYVDGAVDVTVLNLSISDEDLSCTGIYQSGYYKIDAPVAYTTEIQTSNKAHGDVHSTRLNGWLSDYSEISHDHRFSTNTLDKILSYTDVDAGRMRAHAIYKVRVDGVHRKWVSQGGRATPDRLEEIPVYCEKYYRMDIENTTVITRDKLTVRPLTAGSLNASINEHNGSVDLSWSSETTIPESKLSFRIRKVNTATGEVTDFISPTFDYQDVPVLPGVEYRYSVYGRYQYSNSPADAIYSREFETTSIRIPFPVGNYTVRRGRGKNLKVSWVTENSYYFTKLVLEYRDVTANEVNWNSAITLHRLENEDEKAVIVGDNFIQGRQYEIRLSLLDDNDDVVQELSNNIDLPGDGVLSGSVKIPGTNVGIPGVEVKMKGKVPISGAATPDSVLVEETLFTDEEGYFYFSEVYYDEKATFLITVKGDDRIVKPKNGIKRTLSSDDKKQDNILFEDHTSRPIYGLVMIGGCPVYNAQVIYNGAEDGNENGEKWTLSVRSENIF